MICGTVHLEDLLHQFPCQNTGFVTVDVDTDDVTGQMSIIMYASR